jgi:hypothetical protein
MVKISKLGKLDFNCNLYNVFFSDIGSTPRVGLMRDLERFAEVLHFLDSNMIEEHRGILVNRRRTSEGDLKDGFELSPYGKTNNGQVQFISNCVSQIDRNAAYLTEINFEDESVTFEINKTEYQLRRRPVNDYFEG